MLRKIIRQGQDFTGVRGFTIVELVIVLLLLGIFNIIGTPVITGSINNLRIKAALDTIYSDLQFARRSAMNLNRWVEFSFSNEEDAYVSYTIRDLQTAKDLKTGKIGGIRYGEGWGLNSQAFTGGLRFNRRGLPSDLTGQSAGGVLILERDGEVLQGFRIYRTTGFIEPILPGGLDS